ncbi:hypothetical protein AB0J38_06830 [Streptomyces sp. NPDC050095]|uniref:hypothetical protein n=1 Tax=unclassified Streptomyces TaxID=2593676 RepID=UPI00343495C0
MRKALLGCAAAVVCGMTVLGPLPTASAQGPMDPPPPPNAITEQQMRNQARTFHTTGANGQANATVSNFAGDVLQGDKTPEQIAQSQQDVDKSLDNLLAIIPGGSPALRGPNPLLAATIDAIKKETRNMAEARAAGDYGRVLGSGAALTTQMSLLTAQTFANFGIDLAQNIVSTVLPPMQPQPQPTKTPEAQASPAAP